MPRRPQTSSGQISIENLARDFKSLGDDALTQLTMLAARGLEEAYSDEEELDYRFERARATSVGTML